MNPIAILKMIIPLEALPSWKSQVAPSIDIYQLTFNFMFVNTIILLDC